VLVITIYDECCGDGKVDTRPGLGASYYHQIYWNSFSHDPPFLLFEIFETWTISLSLSLFDHAFEHVFPFFSFFLLSPIFFGDICRGINHGIMREALFGGMDTWYNANFQCRSIARVYGVHMNLDHESMKRILTRVTTI